MRMAVMICLLEIAGRIGGKPLDLSGGVGTFIAAMFLVCLLQDAKELFK